MRRKTFDALLTTGGFVVAVVLAVAGGLLLWGHNFAQSNVHNQLAAQQIFFPAKAEIVQSNDPEITKYVTPYAGMQVLTGKQAEVYADHYIGAHLRAMPFHGVYSKISSAARANPSDQDLAALVDTSFKGTTLRGMLLNAYGWGKTGQIAGIAADAAFIGSGLMLLLVGFGIVHTRRTKPDTEVMAWLTDKSPVPVE